MAVSPVRYLASLVGMVTAAVVCVASNFLLTIICPPAVRGVRLFDCF